MVFNKAADMPGSDVASVFGLHSSTRITSFADADMMLARLTEVCACWPSAVVAQWFGVAWASLGLMKLCRPHAQRFDSVPAPGEPSPIIR